jgi:hypothetical protein
MIFMINVNVGIGLHPVCYERAGVSQVVEFLRATGWRYRIIEMLSIYD